MLSLCKADLCRAPKVTTTLALLPGSLMHTFVPVLHRNWDLAMILKRVPGRNDSFSDLDSASDILLRS